MRSFMDIVGLKNWRRKYVVRRGASAAALEEALKIALPDLPAGTLERIATDAIAGSALRRV